jgi:hypothetical protein
MTKRKTKDVIKEMIDKGRAERAAMTREQVHAELRTLADQLANEVCGDDPHISSEVGGIINDLGVWWSHYEQLEDDEESEDETVTP